MQGRECSEVSEGRKQASSDSGLDQGGRYGGGGSSQSLVTC